MLVALSGAQGSGKTTILNTIQTLGFNVVQRKTARSILTEWNMTLDEVYQNPAKAAEFQDYILDRKEDDELEAIKSDDLWFTERSYADLFTYTALTISRYNQYDAWVNEYYRKCLELQKKYLAIVYLEGGAFKTVDDGIRGTNEHYVQLVDQTLFSILMQMQETDPDTFRNLVTHVMVQNSVVDVNERTRRIVNTCHDMWMYKRLPIQTSYAKDMKFIGIDP